MVLTIVLVLLTAALVVYELYGIYTARKKGLTKNLSRLITHTIMIVLLLVLFFQILYFAVRFTQLTKAIP